MDYIYIFSIAIILIFGIFSIKQDIIRRKVKNEITFIFLLIAFIIFISSINKLIWIDFIILFGSILLSFILFYKKIWGAADGKLFIGLALLLTSNLGGEGTLQFALNIVILYALTIIIITIIMTSLKSKIIILKEIDYQLQIFLILVMFTILSSIYYFIKIEFNIMYYLFIFFSIFILIGSINPYVKKFFRSLDEDSKLFINLILFGVFFLFSKEIFILYFLIIFCLKIFILFISILTNEIKYKGKIYNSPFSVYLFAAALFTFVVKTSIVQIIVIFF